MLQVKQGAYNYLSHSVLVIECVLFVTCLIHHNSYQMLVMPSLNLVLE